MEVQVFPQSAIAVIWDFDDTLIPGSMQSPVFQNYEIDEGSFWEEVNGLSKYYASHGTKVNQSSAYLNHMLTYAQSGKFLGLDNKVLQELGAEIEFYAGVIELFQFLKGQALAESAFQKHEIAIEIYVISSGLVRMIKGSKVSQLLDGVWGCEFIEDVAQPGYTTGEQTQLIPSEEQPRQINQIGFIIDDTTKTRAIFQINKGVNKNPYIDVNAQIPFEHRRIPFRNMVYVADGPSDIPVFSLLNQYGGRTYAVYKPESSRHFERVYNLRRQNRIEAYGPADYREGSQTWLWILSTVKDIASRVVDEKERALQSAVQRPPGHVAVSQAVVSL